jgi:Spy/CpxP family protein refolding chaperone
MIFRVAIAALVLALSTLASEARAQGGGKMPPEVADFQKSLNFTPDQKKKLEAIGKKYQPKMLAIQKKYEPQLMKLRQSKDPKAQQQAMALIQKATSELRPLQSAAQKESNAILTPEQRKKIEAFQAKMMAKMQPGGSASKR